MLKTPDDKKKKLTNAKFTGVRDRLKYNIYYPISFIIYEWRIQYIILIFQT